MDVYQHPNSASNPAGYGYVGWDHLWKHWARYFQGSKTIIKKLKDLRQMIYPYSSNWVLLGIWWLVFVFTKQ